MIRVHQLGKRYPSKPRQTGFLPRFLSSTKRAEADDWALREVSFRLESGEQIGIIGKNGSGKSTLLRILAQITAPTEGWVEIEGRCASILGMGVGFHPELSGRENIFLNGSLLGMTSREIKNSLEAIIEFSGLAAHMHQPIKQYSSGMYLRLAFSVAAFLETEILLLDEMLAVGDAAFQRKCLNKFQEMKQKGRSLLLVSHDLNLINHLCDKTLWMEKGKMKAFGKTLEITSNYVKNLDRIQEQARGVFDFKTSDHLANPKKKGFYRAELYCNHQQNNIFHTGAHFRLKTFFSHPQRWVSLRFGIVIKDSYNRAILGLNNENLGQQVEPVKLTQGMAELTIDQLLLYGSGRYTLSLYLGEIGQSRDFDILEEAVYFHLIQTSMYESSRLPEPALNIYHQPHVIIRYY